MTQTLYARMNKQQHKEIIKTRPGRIKLFPSNLTAFQNKEKKKIFIGIVLSL
jgi:hypothetical protein